MTYPIIDFKDVLMPLSQTMIKTISLIDLENLHGLATFLILVNMLDIGIIRL
ncbi:TPA: hypothetical protein ACHVE0_000008 [Streptococcus suis]